MLNNLISPSKKGLIYCDQTRHLVFVQKVIVWFHTRKG